MLVYVLHYITLRYYSIYHNNITASLVDILRYITLSKFGMARDYITVYRI